MNIRQRRLLLLLDTFIKEHGRRPSITELARASEGHDMGTADDINDMRNLGFVYTERTWSGSSSMVVSSLTPKAEKLMPRVRELA